MTFLSTQLSHAIKNPHWNIISSLHCCLRQFSAGMTTTKGLIEVGDDGIDLRKIAYVKVTPNANTQGRPTVVFLHGLFSSMTGGKAVMLEKLAQRLDFPYVRFDFTACGSKNQCLQLLTTVVENISLRNHQFSLGR